MYSRVSLIWLCWGCILIDFMASVLSGISIAEERLCHKYVSGEILDMWFYFAISILIFFIVQRYASSTDNIATFWTGVLIVFSVNFCIQLGSFVSMIVYGNHDSVFCVFRISYSGFLCAYLAFNGLAIVILSYKRPGVSSPPA